MKTLLLAFLILNGSHHGSKNNADELSWKFIIWVCLVHKVTRERAQQPSSLNNWVSVLSVTPTAEQLGCGPRPGSPTCEQMKGPQHSLKRHTVLL